MQGDKGEEGRGISSIEVYFAISASGITAPADSEFDTSVKTPTDAKPYLWSYEVTIFSDATRKTGAKKVVGYKGANGRSVSKVEAYYLATTLASGVTNATSGFTTSLQSISESKPYLWMYTKITYDDEKSESTTAVILGTWQKGDTGKQGEKGPAMRGVQNWEDITDGYQFYSGATGENFYDVVLYGSAYWKCKSSHTKSSSNTPSASSAYWEVFTNFKLVSTECLLADAIYMKDSSGNLVFKAQDGEVECKQGTFENVDVSGNITASTLDLAKDKSFYLASAGATVILPELSNAEYAREITVLTRQEYLNLNSTLTFKGETSNVRIGLPTYDASAITNSITTGTGAFKCIGYCYVGYTYWFVTRLTIATSI
jgi:hypothetical protein